jgi:hypothetical protein
MYTETLTQRLGIAAAINPQTLNNTNRTTGAVDLSKFHRAISLFEIGAVTGGGAITAQLIESASSNLSSPQNLGGSAGTLAGLNTANQQYSIEVRADQLDAGYRYVGLKLTETGSQNVVVCAIALGDEAAHKPGNAANDASVAQQNVI